MICRDRDTDPESGGFETRDYVLQNWRADVVALAAADGDLLERISYDPYGVPFATHPTDLTLGATPAAAGFFVFIGVVFVAIAVWLLIAILRSGSAPAA